MVKRKRVAVIGGGASGLVAIKCCLDEGLDPVCFERTNDIGGLWNFSETVVEGQSSVMKTTVINSSKEIMCYSDFPADKECPNFMHHTKMLQYFRDYANNFNLLTHIQFEVKVLSVKQAPDYDETGCWTIKTEQNGEDKTDVFDAVLVCTGHHADKNMASFPNEETFLGKIIHTHDYRSHKGFEDKRVVVVGIGNSGVDIAVDLGKIAAQVYLSTRRGSWIMNRVGRAGIPYDLEFLSRNRSLIPKSLYRQMIQWNVESRFNHTDYGLRPNHKITSGLLTVNDELPNRIISGTVVIKHNIERITEKGVVFTDGSSVDDIDVIVYATGYKFGFPFLDDPALQGKDNKLPKLYKYMYPADYKHPTIAVIGYVEPKGALIPISEMQCRLATHVFKGNKCLPSRELMKEDIRQKEVDMAACFYVSRLSSIQMDYISFMDELADLLGCKPDLKRLWLSDPKLAFNVFFGPCTPYQYRLTGPGAWSGARNAILTQWDRIYHPLRESRKIKAEAQGVQVWHVVLVMVIIAWVIRMVI